MLRQLNNSTRQFINLKHVTTACIQGRIRYNIMYTRENTLKHYVYKGEYVKTLCIQGRIRKNTMYTLENTLKHYVYTGEYVKTLCIHGRIR